MSSPGPFEVKISSFGVTESGREITLTREQLDNISPLGYAELRKLVEKGEPIPDDKYNNWFAHNVETPAERQAQRERELLAQTNQKKPFIGSVEYPLFLLFGGKYHTYYDSLDILCDICKLEHGILDDYCPGLIIPLGVSELLQKSLIAFRDGRIYGNDGYYISKAEAALDEAYQEIKNLILDRFKKFPSLAKLAREFGRVS